MSKKPKTVADEIAESMKEVVTAISSAKNSGLIDLDILPIKHLTNKANDARKHCASKAYELLALLKAYQGHYSEANKLYLNAIANDTSDKDMQYNYLNILLSIGEDEKAKKWITDNYRPNEMDGYIFLVLFKIAYFNLDFDLFEKYFNASNKNGLFDADIYKRDLSSIPGLKKLGGDLAKVGIKKSDFADFIKFLYSFYSRYTHSSFRLNFEIDEELNWLVVIVFLNVSPEVASGLTADFDYEFIKFSNDINRHDYLSKFAVFFRPKVFSSEYTDSYGTFSYEDLV